MQQKIRPNLWFDGNAEEAAEFYTSVFPNSKVNSVVPYPENSPGEAGTTMIVEFELDGTSFIGINGGPDFTFNEATSFEILCEDQTEIDYYWERLTDGGSEVQCGWLKDRFGLSWQVTPRAMDEIMGGGDAAANERAMQAMLKMKKLDIAALEAAAKGEPVA